jgi:exodeoxyribonuclease III
MKIIAWNCNMAIRKKAGIILALQPDILVIPECEHPDKLKFNPEISKPVDTLWFGKNLNKGLGIFSYSNFRFTVLDIYNPDLKMVIPISVKGKNIDFILFAVWANNPGDPDGHYVEQVWKAIHHYDDLLTNKKIILAGDFNSNTIWDRPRRKGNHSAVVEYLHKKGIHSVYHKHFNQVQGKEEHPTQYMYRHRDKPYHLDYCFTSTYFSKKLISVEIGDYDYWIPYSDHVPVIATFNK